MATTFLTRITKKPLAMFNDGTNLYIGTNEGRVKQVVISTKAETLLRQYDSPVTALQANSDNTILYVGLATGELHSLTIATKADTLNDWFTAGVQSFGLSSTNLYIGLNNGKIELKDLS